MKPLVEGKGKPWGEGRAEPGEPEGTAGGSWGSERPRSPQGAERGVRAALTSPLVMLIAK